MIRATRVEIILPKERKPSWRHLAEQCQSMTNRMWQLWLCHHVQNDSANKMRAHLDAYSVWKKATGKKGKKPKTPVFPIDKQLSNRIYHAIAKEFPDVNARTRTLLQNKWQQTVSTRKAASGNLSGWLSILFCRESIPSFTRPVPIPFDKENGNLDNETGRYMLTVRVERLYDPDAKVSPSVVDKCVLLLGKRKTRSVIAVIERILSGEYKFKGSSLAYSRGKWFALISYEMPQQSKVLLDGKKVMHVWPSAKQPWMVQIDGGSFAVGGTGQHVRRFREMLTRGRWERQEHYRWSGSAQKGRGRKRACMAWTKLSDRWKHFVKRYNHEVTRRVVRLAIDRRCGQIVYHQPMGDRRERCYLSRGLAARRSQTWWDYFQFGTLLAGKCEENGIDFDVKKREYIKEIATG